MFKIFRKIFNFKSKEIHSDSDKQTNTNKNPTKENSSDCPIYPIKITDSDKEDSLLKENSTNLINTLNKIILIKINTLNNEDIYDLINFEVTEDSGSWVLYESICQLGGCSFNGVYFQSEREALLEALNLTLKNQKPSYYACPECYREYMKECY